jgi:lysozyme
MHIDKEGIEFLRHVEGVRHKAYMLYGEKYFTIGVGHSYDPLITANTVWTDEQINTALQKDVQKFEKYVEKHVKIPLNQHQFNALVSYTFNRGEGGIKELAAHSITHQEYADNMVRYWGKAVKFKDALIQRRKKERALFLKDFTSTKKSTKEIVKEVLAGKWGVGAERKQRLTEAGYNYKEIQMEINKILSNSSSSV